MTEQDFLQTYDPQSFEHPSVAVDVALLTVQNKELQTLLLLRHEHPYKDFWTLPGGFVGMNESLEEAAARTLKQKVGLEKVFLEQLYTFGNPKRDPRMRVISVAYYALVSFEKLSSPKHTTLATLREVKGKLELRLEGQPIQLGFDHAEILHVVLQRLRGKLEYAPLGYELLPKHFTLRELQDVHESILGKKLNKDSFRRRMLASGELQATGKMETGREFRPAEKYRRKNTESRR